MLNRRKYDEYAKEHGHGCKTMNEYADKMTKGHKYAEGGVAKIRKNMSTPDGQHQTNTTKVRNTGVYY